MKALVVGATGMLGHYLVERLLCAGYTIRALIQYSSMPGTLDAERIELVRGDLTHPDLIERAVAGVDTVFHLAAHFATTSAFDVTKPAEIYGPSNVELTRLLLEASLHEGVTRFVYASSSGVYSARASAPIAESAPLLPQTAYGRAKLAAEEAVNDFHARGLATTIVRPCVMYGAYDRHFLPSVIQLSGLPFLPLIDGGRALQDLVHAADVASLVLLASESPGAAGKTYNAASGSPEPFIALFETLVAALGRRPRVVSIPKAFAIRLGWLPKAYLRAYFPDLAPLASATGIEYLSRDLYYDISLAKSDLNYQPAYDFRAGLHEAMHHLDAPMP